MSIKLAGAASSLALAATFATAPLTGVQAADPFSLTSPTFKDGDIWPSKYADNRPNAQNVNACGAGQNVSPPLAWANPPDKTKTFAIMMIDTDGGNGLGSVHWVAYDLPATKMSLAEGEASEAPKGWAGGKNGRSEIYSGPCPPAGHLPHHYIINVIATDLDPGMLKPGMTRDELIAALRGHALGTAGIVAKYARPTS